MFNETFGDVTLSDLPGKKVLPHIVNNVGVAGSGVVVAIEKNFEINAIKKYRDWAHNHVCHCDLTGEDIPFQLGEVQFVDVGRDYIIANMVAQKCPGMGEKIDGQILPPIRYEALMECMMRVSEFSKIHKARIVAPKFGSLRAGGNWNVIKSMINDHWAEIDVTIYDYKE